MYIDINKFQNCACDSDMIQMALDEAKVIGASVVIPKRNKRTGRDIWEISRTVYLYDESILILQNCHLRMEDDSICNMFSNKKARTESVTKQEGKQRNISKCLKRWRSDFPLS